MIVVRVELHSAITGLVTEIARMDICNVGGDAKRGDYDGRTMRGRSRYALAKQTVSKQARVEAYPRQSLHVWNLVTRMLSTMGYR